MHGNASQLGLIKTLITRCPIFKSWIELDFTAINKTLFSILYRKKNNFTL